MFAYQLAVVVDDALTGVTEVVRGSDLLSARRASMAIRELGLTPPAFATCRCCWRIACAFQRDGDEAWKTCPGREYSAEEIIGKLAFACSFATPARDV